MAMGRIKMALARLIAAAALALGLMTAFAPTASAWGCQCDQRPGYGYGDQNHCHTGPPGLDP
jgi:hypothetical protein